MFKFFGGKTISGFLNVDFVIVGSPGVGINCATVKQSKNMNQLKFKINGTFHMKQGILLF
jgi:hypothetical protein